MGCRGHLLIRVILCRQGKKVTSYSLLLMGLCHKDNFCPNAVLWHITVRERVPGTGPLFTSHTTKSSTFSGKIGLSTYGIVGYLFE